MGEYEGVFTQPERIAGDNYPLRVSIASCDIAGAVVDYPSLSSCTGTWDFASGDSIWLVVNAPELPAELWDFALASASADRNH